jgi:hypothetical protein
VEGADYLYHLSQGSRSHSGQALAQARAGYLQILELVEQRPWPRAIRDLVRRVFREDLAAVEAARGGEASWRAAVRDGGRR